jgi:hypothetical protein
MLAIPISQKVDCIIKYVTLYKAIFRKVECKMMETIYKLTMKEDIGCGL